MTDEPPGAAERIGARVRADLGDGTLVPQDAPLDLRETGNGVTLRVRVQPRAAREGLGGVREGALVVRLTAPPVEGAANRALARFLARAMGVAPSAIEILRGDRGRDKLVRIEGVSTDAARTRLVV